MYIEKVHIRYSLITEIVIFCVCFFDGLKNYTLGFT